jgi:hypothetical protein
MKTAVKNIIYLIVMIGMSGSECFASEMQGHISSAVERFDKNKKISQAYKNYYWLYSFFKTSIIPCIRKTENSNIFYFRCGNIYKDLYQEEHKNSILIDLSFFNRYAQNIKIKNNHSSRIFLSVGDVQPTSNGLFSLVHDVPNCATDLSISVGRDFLKVLCIIAIAYKIGALQKGRSIISIALQQFLSRLF